LTLSIGLLVVLG